MSHIKELTKGIFKENPTFIIMLGMCPTLGVSTQVSNALGMGASVIFVLTCSNIFISLLRKVIPDSVRIPCYIVIIASFVTIIDLLMQAYLPELHLALGIYIPLIVVNCIILGRAEAFASKNSVLQSIYDGIGMGCGFLLALTLLGSLRELLGNGTLFGWDLFGEHITPMLIFIMPPGAFLALAAIILTVNKLRRNRQ